MKLLKIALGKIEQNPFRDFEINPLEDERTNALILAVESDEFWSNMQVRKHPKKKDKYQLVYGHHRMEVLKRLKHKDWTFELTNLPDEIMFLRMTDENLHQGGKSPLAMEEAIVGAKKILDGYLKKSKTLEDLRGTPWDTPDLGENNFVNLKKTGAGIDLVHTYLGGRISKHNVAMFLSVMKPDHEEEREAIRTFDTVRKGREFTRAVRKHKLTPDETKRYATQMKHTASTSMDEEVGRKKAGEKQWAKMVGDKKKATAQRKAGWRDRWAAKEKATFESYVEGHAASCDVFEREMLAITPFLEDLAKLDPALLERHLNRWRSIANHLNIVLSGVQDTAADAKVI